MFHVGQHVVCVNTCSSGALTKGAVYTVAEVGEVPEGFLDSGDTYLMLVEVAPPPPYRSFPPKAFRPLSEDRLSIFRSLLTKTEEVA